MEPTQARIELVREDGTIRMGGTDVSMEDMARMLDIFLAATARLDEEHAQEIREGHTWDMG